VILLFEAYSFVRNFQEETRVRAVDDRFWDECVRARPHLVRIASRHAPAPSQAEDIVHDALLRAAEFDRLDLDRLQPFLVTVVKRLCVDDARRTGVASRAYGHPRLEPCAPRDPAELACDRAEASWAAGKLSDLAPRERTLVAMAAGGLSQSDIAAAHGTTVGATQTALHRVRGKIRTWLSD
jgi:RNA polymerase sigma factor (sigma-70 family)